MKRFLVTRVRTETTSEFIYADDEDKALDIFEEKEEKGLVDWDERSEVEIEEHND